MVFSEPKGSQLFSRRWNHRDRGRLANTTQSRYSSGEMCWLHSFLPLPGLPIDQTLARSHFARKPGKCSPLGRVSLYRTKQKHRDGSVLFIQKINFARPMSILMESPAFILLHSLPDSKSSASIQIFMEVVIKLGYLTSNFLQPLVSMGLDTREVSRSFILGEALQWAFFWCVKQNEFLTTLQCLNGMD